MVEDAYGKLIRKITNHATKVVFRFRVFDKLFVLLKRKTTGEAKTLVTSADRDNRLESWRILVSQFEPQVGIKKMKEICDPLSRQHKRCKNPAESALIFLEMGRRQKLIAEIGGKPVDNVTTSPGRTTQMAKSTSSWRQKQVPRISFFFEISKF